MASRFVFPYNKYIPTARYDTFVLREIWPSKEKVDSKSLDVTMKTGRSVQQSSQYNLGSLDQTNALKHADPRFSPLAPFSLAVFSRFFFRRERVEKEGYETLEALGATKLARVDTAGGGAANPMWTAMRQRLLNVPTGGRCACVQFVML